MKKYNIEKFAAFTLAETLTVLLILGIIAALLIPSMIKNYRHAIYRTKLKKAMATYETAFNNMVLDSGIYRDTDTLNRWANTDKMRQNSPCFKSKTYFNILKQGYNNCVFRTPDGIWWDISDVSNPLISLKDEITSNNNQTLRNNATSLDSDKTSFVMTGSLVATSRTKSEIRLNDKGYEDSLENNDNNKAYLSKLYTFLDERSGSGGNFIANNNNGGNSSNSNNNNGNSNSGSNGNSENNNNNNNNNNNGNNNNTNNNSDNGVTDNQCMKSVGNVYQCATYPRYCIQEQNGDMCFHPYSDISWESMSVCGSSNIGCMKYDDNLRNTTIVYDGDGNVIGTYIFGFGDSPYDGPLFIGYHRDGKNGDIVMVTVIDTSHNDISKDFGELWTARSWSSVEDFQNDMQQHSSAFCRNGGTAQYIPEYKSFGCVR